MVDREFKLDQSITPENLPQVIQTMSETLQHADENIIIDLNGIKYLNYLDVAFLIATYHTASGRSIPVSLSNVSKDVKTEMEYVRLHDYFDIYYQE